MSVHSATAYSLPAAHALLVYVRRVWSRHTSARALLHATAALAAAGAVLILLDYAVSLPVPMRAVLRALPMISAVVIVARAGVRVLRAPEDASIALLAEERAPALAGYFTTALASTGSGVVADEFRKRAAPIIEGVARQKLVMPSLRRDALACGAAILSFVVLAAPAGARDLWQRWVHLEPAPLSVALPGMPIGSAAAAARTSAFSRLRVHITPPAYTGLSARDVSDSQPIEAVVGSIIEVSGTLPPDVERVEAALIGGDAANTTVEAATNGRRWRATWRAAALHRGVDLQSIGTGDVMLERRVLPALISVDREPRVALEDPSEDLVLARAEGNVHFGVSADDDFGVTDLRLQWILSRGSGESFTFTEGEWPVSMQRAGGAVRAERTVDLAALGLGPGDVLHVRALARDGNDVTGPGTGVSATRLLRIAREDEMADVSTLIGFPLEAEKEPVLSQRMIILLTERLIAQSASMDATVRLAESERIAREQGRLREHVADVIFAGERGGADAHEEHETFDRRETPVTAADSARRIQELLEAASRATGQGTLEELGHQHDPDPSLAVNRPLLAAFNAMYDAERALRLGEPRTALPHEYRALEVLQEIRAAERVFLRGRQAVAPVDVAGVRGTGKLDDAEPTSRSAAPPAISAAAHADAITALISGLPGRSAREASLDLSALAAAVLSDAAADARAGALLTRAAEAVAAGHPEDAHSLALQARALLTPNAAVTNGPVIPSAAHAVDAAYLARLHGSPPRAPADDARGRNTQPFVFATLRYESGDWDSGQLVPANLIHSMALYTDVPVAPQGVIVDLSSSDILRYPLLYMTGHLPVRFSAAEGANLKTFVERGGVVFIDDHNHDIDGAFHRTAVAELRRIFGQESLQDLPNDHELYRTFFSFSDGPPTTSHELNGWGDGLIHEHLLAVMYGGRIGVLYSNKDYTSEWSYHYENKRFQREDNTRFGVNLIIYSLTR